MFLFSDPLLLTWPPDISYFFKEDNRFYQAIFSLPNAHIFKAMRYGSLNKNDPLDSYLNVYGVA